MPAPFTVTSISPELVPPEPNCGMPGLFVVWPKALNAKTQSNGEKIFFRFNFMVVKVGLTAVVSYLSVGFGAGAAAGAAGAAACGTFFGGPDWMNGVFLPGRIGMPGRFFV